MKAKKDEDGLITVITDEAHDYDLLLEEEQAEELRDTLNSALN